ncbi:multiheme c-type cytochrome [Candidatus Riflebacteria bacterium]
MVKGRYFFLLIFFNFSSLLSLQPWVKRPSFKPIQSNSGKSEIKFEDFAGSKACAECHQHEFNQWNESTHAHAGGLPGDEVIISKFQGTVLNLKDAVVRLSINNKKEYLVNVELEGGAKQVFRVDAVVGGGHMVGGGTQALFSLFPDGTLRFLPFDFIKKENLWFVELKKENGGWTPIKESPSINKCTNWPPWRILGLSRNFEVSCASCHGSQILVNYNPEKKKYETRFKSLGINCESCHGAGKRHIELAKSGEIENQADIGLKELSQQNKDGSLNVCFQCHSRNVLLQSGDFLPGKEFESYFSTKLRTGFFNEFHADGRIKDFGYQKNHLYSDCYISGSMTCVDCHDPHSQKYRDIRGKVLVGRFDNEQCLDCHESKREKIKKHSHHKKGSTGSLCTSCHMPFLQHPALGNKLRFARSDHTIPIPRPAFDSSLGIEDACSKCHKDRTVEELQKITDSWYGKVKPHKPIISTLSKATGITDQRTAGRLLLDDSHFHPIAQIKALVYFLQQSRLAAVQVLELDIIEKLKKFSFSPDVDLQALALATLHLISDNHPGIHSFLLKRAGELGINEIPVKLRWSLVLNFFALDLFQIRQTDKAIALLKKALKISSRDERPHLLLGKTLHARAEKSQALVHLKKALGINPNFAQAHFFIANLYAEMGQKELALKHFEWTLNLRQGDEKLSKHIQFLQQIIRDKF